MLTGEGLHRKRNLQLNFEIEAYGQVISTGKNAWNKLLSPGKQTEVLCKFNQGHDELFHDDILIKWIKWRYRSWRVWEMNIKPMTILLQYTFALTPFRMKGKYFLITLEYLQILASHAARDICFIEKR